MSLSQWNGRRFRYMGWIVSGILGTSVALGAIAMGAGMQRKPMFPAGEKSSKAFKNIQVLKDLPANQLIPVMENISASLGVRCGFCHVMGPNHTGFEKDTKPAKIMARKMMLMTRRINAREKLLGGRASCYMCHHGQAKPTMMAPSENDHKTAGRMTGDQVVQLMMGTSNG